MVVLRLLLLLFLHPPPRQGLVDRAAVGGQVRQRVEHLPLAYDRVDEVGVAVELVLDDVVEHLEQEEDQVVVGGRGEQEPRGREGLEEMEQLAGRHHAHRLDVGRHVAQDCQQAIEERL